LEVKNSFANTSSSLIGAKYNGIIIDFLLTPFSYIELTLGFMIGGMVRGLVVGSVTYLVATFFYGGTVVGSLAVILLLVVTYLFKIGYKVKS